MTFVKGKSGNPNGAPKRDNLAAAECRKHYLKAINVYLRNLASEDEAIAQKAADALLARGFGQPIEYVETETIETRDPETTEQEVYDALAKMGITPEMIKAKAIASKN